MSLTVLYGTINLVSSYLGTSFVHCLQDRQGGAGCEEETMQVPTLDSRIRTEHITEKTTQRQNTQSRNNKTSATCGDGADAAGSPQCTALRHLFHRVPGGGDQHGSRSQAAGHGGRSRTKRERLQRKERRERRERRQAKGRVMRSLYKRKC